MNKLQDDSIIDCKECTKNIEFTLTIYTEYIQKLEKTIEELNNRIKELEK